MIRSSQIYIRYETRRLLRIIAKARGMDESVDAVGDELLHKAIIAACPELKPFIQEMDAIELRMAEAIENVAKPSDGRL